MKPISDRFIEPVANVLIPDPQHAYAISAAAHVSFVRTHRALMALVKTGRARCLAHLPGEVTFYVKGSPL
jgi:hypothetical protein